MASTQQHCACCTYRQQQTHLSLPPTELPQLTRTMSAAPSTLSSAPSDVFTDADEQPLERAMSPGRALALGYSDVPTPVHTVIDPMRLRSRRSSSRHSRSSTSEPSRSSSVTEPAMPLRPAPVAPQQHQEVFGETAAQRSERKAREREFWDIRKPHFWNMVGGGYSGGKRSS